MAKNTMELFSDEAPEVAAAFNNLIMAVVRRPALDAKTKQLIYIAMKAAMGDDTAVKAHIPMAKAAGATREEVIDAILMTVTVSGSGVSPTVYRTRCSSLRRDLFSYRFLLVSLVQENRSNIVKKRLN